ncbi:MAG TPA: hypothetical protein VGG01_03660 [Xanthobacteraceae bacterium]|jgi:hypothetical protein
MSHGVKTFLSVIAIMLTTLCDLTAPAQAQFIFNPLQNLGGSVVTAPSCAGAPSGSTFCGAVGANGHLFLNQIGDLASLGNTDVGGIVIGRPSCTHFAIAQSQFRVLCGVIGTDSALWVTRFDGSASSGFVSLGGISISNPACTGLSGSTKAVCVVIGTNSHLFASTTQDGVNWTAFTDLDLGGTLIFNPTCMDIGDMIGFCGAVTTDGELRLRRFQAASGSVAWQGTSIITFPPTPPEALPKARVVTGVLSIPSTLRITSDPSCAAGRSAAVICGVRGSDSALYVSQFNGATFSPFQFEGGVLAGAPSCAFAVCAARGADSQLYVIQPGLTAAFKPVPGTNLSGDPSCTLHPNELLTTLMLCGVRSTDSTLWITIAHP